MFSDLQVCNFITFLFLHSGRGKSVLYALCLSNSCWLNYLALPASHVVASTLDESIQTTLKAKLRTRDWQTRAFPSVQRNHPGAIWRNHIKCKHPDALVRRWLTDWSDQVPMSRTTAGRVKWHSWSRTTRQCRSFPCYEMPLCCMRLLHSQLLFHLGFFLFEIHRSCFTDLLNHPVTHICTLAIKIFAFLLSQHRQEMIRSALVTEMHAAAGM